MKKNFRPTRIGMIIAAALTLAQIPCAASFYDGSALNRLGAAHRRASEQRASNDDYSDAYKFQGYIAATSDAFNNAVFCIPLEATIGQLCAVTFRFTEDHPERWNEPAMSLVVTALKAAFPCSKKR